MKALLILLAVVVVAALLWLVVPSGGKKGWQPGTTMTFLGFTNTIAGAPATNAWFGFTRIPPEETQWETVEVSSLEGGQWVKLDPLPRPSLAWVNPSPTNFTVCAAVPLPTTNAPLRVVVELKRSWNGRRWNFLKRFTPSWLLPRRVFHISAEFNPGSATNSVAR